MSDTQQIDAVDNKKIAQNSILNNLIRDKINYDVRKTSYEYAVLMILNSVGIQRTEKTIRNWAAYQEAGMNVNTVLTKIKEFLQKLGKLSNSDGTELSEHQIKVWLTKNGNSSELAQFKDDIKKLFYDDGNGTWKNTIKDKNGHIIVEGGKTKKTFLNEYEVALHNVDIVDDVTSDPTVQSISTMLEHVFGEGSFPGWNDPDSQIPYPFSYYLNKILDPKYHGGEHKYDDTIIKIFHDAYDKSWQYNHAETDKQKNYTDYIGNASSSVGMDAQLANGASNQSSTAISMNAQMLSSYVNIGQNVTQSASQGKQAMVQNQKSA